MSEPATGGALLTCSTTTAICIPLFQSLGVSIDAALMGGAGVVIAQTLLPREGPVSYAGLAKIAAGSILFASIAAPIAAHVVVKYVPAEMATGEQLRGVTAALMGGFAAPIIVWVRDRIGGVLKTRRRKT